MSHGLGTGVHAEVEELRSALSAANARVTAAEEREREAVKRAEKWQNECARLGSGIVEMFEDYGDENDGDIRPEKAVDAAFQAIDDLRANARALRVESAEANTLLKEARRERLFQAERACGWQAKSDAMRPVIEAARRIQADNVKRKGGDVWSDYRELQADLFAALRALDASPPDGATVMAPQATAEDCERCVAKDNRIDDDTETINRLRKELSEYKNALTKVAVDKMKLRAEAADVARRTAEAQREACAKQAHAHWWGKSGFTKDFTDAVRETPLVTDAAPVPAALDSGYCDRCGNMKTECHCIVPPGGRDDLCDWLGITCGLLGMRCGDADVLAAEVASWPVEPDASTSPIEPSNSINEPAMVPASELVERIRKGDT